MNFLSCASKECMDTVTAEDIVKATGGKLLSRHSDVFKGISIDSRTIQSIFL